MLRVLLVVATLGLTIYAAFDCIQTVPRSVRHVPKWLWLLVIILLPWIGPGLWLFARRGAPTPPSAPRRTRGGPRGPEDDPDFLRNL